VKTQEQFIILGTAGHIDHGKTTLVKALTGKDTDAHKEEKERGITIDIGFAPFTLPDGRRIGVIDVPGHERFIKNMLAGAGGIDLILLVIDANEGIMPQTVEHLHILEMLHVQKGVIVLTKIDTVDPEWLEMVEEEVRGGLADTFLADAPIVKVAAQQGVGIEELRAEIARLADEVTPRELTAPLRMPVDRIFSVAGFGTVVTGTIFAGGVKVGDTVEVLPEGKPARVRTIQVHGEDQPSAQAGQRAALNLAGVERADLERGMVIAQPGLFRATTRIDARMHLLADSPRSLSHRTRIRLYIGASEVMGRVSLLEGNKILPGDDELVQIHLEEPIICEAQDRFIIRTYSPMLTVGGGTVIDPYPQREHRRRRDYVLEELVQREQGGPEVHVLQALSESPGLTAGEIATAIKSTPEIVGEILAMLHDAGRVLPMAAGGWVSAEWLASAFDEIEERMRAHFAKEKYHVAVPKAQVLSQLGTTGTKMKPKLFDALLAMPEGQARFEVLRDKMLLRGYEVPFTLREKELIGQILELYRAGGFQPASVEEVRTSTKALEKTLHGLLYYLKERGDLVEIADGMILAAEAVEQAKAFVRQHVQVAGAVTVAEFRDGVGTSRKYALGILEYLDAQKFTKRVEDKRVLV
jgi:selenocysteine-specific elongation factor